MLRVPIPYWSWSLLDKAELVLAASKTFRIFFGVLDTERANQSSYTESRYLHGKSVQSLIS